MPPEAFENDLPEIDDALIENYAEQRRPPSPELNDAAKHILNQSKAESQGIAPPPSKEDLSWYWDMPRGAINGIVNALDATKDLFTDFVVDPPSNPIQGGVDYVTGKVIHNAQSALTGEKVSDLEKKSADFKQKNKAQSRANAKSVRDLTDVKNPLGETTTTAGDITQSIAQFSTGFLTTRGMNVLKNGTKAQKFLGLTLQSGLTGFVAFEGDDESLADVARAIGLDNPLATNPDDTEWEKRSKQALSEAFGGAVADGLLQVSKSVLRAGKEKSLLKQIGKAQEDTLASSKRIQEATASLKKAPEEVKPDLPENATESLLARQKIIKDLPELEAEALDSGLTKEDLLSRKLADEMHKMERSGDLAKAREIQKEEFLKAQEAFKPIQVRMEAGDTKAIEEFWPRAMEYLKLDGAVQDAHTVSARAIGAQSHAAPVRARQELLESIANGKTRTKRQAMELLFSAKNAEEAAGLVDKLAKRHRSTGGKIIDIVNEIYVNHILSSPVTLAIDTIATPLWSGLWLGGERFATAAISGARHKAKDLLKSYQAKGLEDATALGLPINEEQKVLFREGSVLLTSYFKAAFDGAKLLRQSIKDEQSIKDGFKKFGQKVADLRFDTRTKFETSPHTRAIYMEKKENASDAYNSVRGIVNFYGSLVTTPTRYMAAKDDMAKAILFRAESKALALRQASHEGLKGEEFLSRVDELIAAANVSMKNQDVDNNSLTQLIEQFNSNSPEAIGRRISNDALDFAREATFTNDLGPRMQKIAQSIEGTPFKLLIPFIKTPTNIITQALQRGPTSLLGRRFYQDFAAGGARRDAALAKLSVGTAMFGQMFYLAQQGLITPDGLTRQEEEALRDGANWRPNSIRIGGTYYDVSRYDPISSLIMLPAAIVKSIDYMENEYNGDEKTTLEQAVANGIMSFAHAISNKTFFTGIAKLVEILEEGEKGLGEKGANLVNSTLGSLLVPNVATFFANEITGEVQYSHGLVGELQRRLGMSDMVRTNAFGDKVTRDPSFMGYVLPISHADIAKADPTAQKLLDERIFLTKPNRRVFGVEISRQQHVRLMELVKESGVKGRINRVMGSKYFDSLLPGDKAYSEFTGAGMQGVMTKKRYIEAMYEEAVDNARMKLIMENPDLKLRITGREKLLLQNVKQSSILDTQLKGLSEFK